MIKPQAHEVNLIVDPASGINEVLASEIASHVLTTKIEAFAVNMATVEDRAARAGILDGSLQLATTDSEVEALTASAVVAAEPEEAARILIQAGKRNVQARPGSSFRRDPLETQHKIHGATKLVMSELIDSEDPVLHAVGLTRRALEMGEVARSRQDDIGAILVASFQLHEAQDNETFLETLALLLRRQTEDDIVTNDGVFWAIHELALSMAKTEEEGANVLATAIVLDRSESVASKLLSAYDDHDFSQAASARKGIQVPPKVSTEWIMKHLNASTHTKDSLRVSMNAGDQEQV